MLFSLKGNNSGGFTLVELMITLMVAAIGVALAVPSYQQVIRKRHTESRSEQLASFINHAHAEAVKRFAPLTVNLAWASEASWCAGAVLGTAACDCTGADSTRLCTIGSAPFSLVSEPGFKAGLQDPDVAGNSATFTFDPVRGVLADDADSRQNHEFRFRSDNGHFVAAVTVLPTGRISICSDGDQRLTTFEVCR